MRLPSAATLAVAALLLPAGVSQAAPGDYAGVQLHSLWSTVSRHQMYADLNTARALRVSAVRIDVGWGSVQSSRRHKDRAYVRKLTAFMRGAARRHIKVIATLMSTPCWASSAPASRRQGCRGRWWNRGVEWYPPRHAQTFARFVRWFSARYGRYLAAVEIWNEPDAPGRQYWHARHPARSYATLLKAAYPASKRSAPGVPVLAGSLAGADSRFLGALYADGIEGHYDGLALHPYCQPAAPNARVARGHSARWAFLDGIEAIHRMQDRHGDLAPLWLTEFGWATGHGFAEISAARQARYTALALGLANRTAYVASAIVYALHDDGANPLDWRDNLGLLTSRGRRKPVFYAVRAVLSRARAAG